MINIDVTEGEKKSFNKPTYFDFSLGQHLVRILGDSRKVYTHYLKSANVLFECPGDDCPICINNKRIYTEHPDNFYKVPGYTSRSERHYFNVLDRTEVKTCTTCQAEVKKDASGKFPAVCADGHLVVESTPHPSEKVKVMNVSKTNANRLKDYQLSILDESGEPVGLEKFDILFMVTKGERKDIVPMPIKDNNDDVDVPEDALYDLESVVVKLSPEEILDLIKGVSLKDIFVARKGVDVEEKAVEASADVQKALDELYN